MTLLISIGIIAAIVFGIGLLAGLLSGAFGWEFEKTQSTLYAIAVGALVTRVVELTVNR